MRAEKSKRIAYGTTICLTVLFSLICIMFLLRPNEFYVYEGEYSFTEGVPVENMVLFEGISLKPGVYYVELEYAAQNFQNAYCTLYDGTVFTGGLLTNGEHLHRNLERTGFHMWLFEGTENLQVQVSYGGNGALRTGSICFTETNGLWTMLLTIMLLQLSIVQPRLELPLIFLDHL